MKYIPKIPDGDVNKPKTSILREFIFILFVLFLFIFIIYICLGFVVDILVEKVPSDIEEIIGYSYIKDFEGKRLTKKEIKLQKFLDELVSFTDMKNRKFKVRILETENVNALAMPGGNIIVFSGLFKKINSENQLAYVLSHELGHFAHRDHLRAIGRGLILSFISIVLFGADNFYNKTMSKSLIGIQLKYTREQEKKADLFAVDLLNKKYKNVSGITDLLEKFGKYEQVPKSLTFFVTHPHYTDRIKIIQQYIKNNNYKIAKEKSLDPIYKKN